MSTRKIEAMPAAFMQAKQDAPQKEESKQQAVAVPAGQRERTFIMIKPDGVQRGLIGKII